MFKYISRSFSNLSRNKLLTGVRIEDVKRLNSDLKKACEDNRFEYLTYIQKECMDDLFDNKQNLLVGEEHTGKTFLSILYVVNKLYMLKKNKTKNAKNGVLFVVKNKSIGIEVYKTFKQLDHLKQLYITRLGSVSQMSVYTKNMVF